MNPWESQHSVNHGQCAAARLLSLASVDCTSSAATSSRGGIGRSGVRWVLKTAGRPGSSTRLAQRGGFTLIETIVAIAAVALVTVGLASIFDSVGKTVKGGKRISLLNQYAGLVENQMRRDFSRMTRDGFLLIRHEFADRNQDGRFDPVADAIPLFQDDASPRPRRTDQLLFFTSGNQTTSRPPLHPDVIVSGGSAMVYYGHGQRRREDSSYIDPKTLALKDTIFLEPQVDDTNADDFSRREARLGAARNRADETANPNFYPKDWTLLRRSTLLVRPNSAGSNSVTSAVKFGTRTYDPSVPADRRRIADSEFQLGLQPVARSVFRALNRYYPRGPDNGLPRQEDSFRVTRRPVLASGLVDLAATDLREIRSMVEMLGGSTPPITSTSFPGRRTPVMPGIFDPDLDTTSNINLEDLFYSWAWTDPALWHAGVGGIWNFNSPPRTTPAPTFDLDMMQLWMCQAFPTEGSAGPRYGAPGGSTLNNTAWRRDPTGVRMRYEPQMPDFVGLLGNNVLTPPIAQVPLEQQVAIARADQMMLAGNGFLPHCSEFIVEWSFGLTDAITNDTIWYGPAQRFDSNNSGAIDGSDRFASLPYPYNTTSQTTALANYDIEIPRLASTDLLSPSAVPLTDFSQVPRDQRFYKHRITPRLIYGYNFLVNTPEFNISRTAHFGYIDPTYTQDTIRTTVTGGVVTYIEPGRDGLKNYGAQFDRDRSGTIEPNEVIRGEPAAAAIPWAWPKMVRVTITLADATDPSVESTFQYVFAVPVDPPLVITP